ncbi:Trypsin CFT-1 [Eumeta japonica]|uniref:Trypsin CFT-1 n=1 Tax=Eumeta variegata TaxID=151549 RepID=A0A4C2A762_EUMVA|nr:Trypsin CFT-1 [Eumeta japonica]
MTEETLRLGIGPGPGAVGRAPARRRTQHQQEQCNELYRLYPGGPITDNMFCGGILDGGERSFTSYEAGKDACQSDSGGPVLYAGVVVGVTSWGAGCADAHHPGVSARVSTYTDWIQKVMSKSVSSEIWTYFTLCDAERARCKICNNEYPLKGRTTTAMRNHLKSMHKNEFAELEKCEKVKKDALSRIATSSQKSFKSEVKQMSFQECVDKTKQWDNKSVKSLAVDKSIKRVIHHILELLEDSPAGAPSSSRSPNSKRARLDKIDDSGEKKPLSLKDTKTSLMETSDSDIEDEDDIPLIGYQNLIHLLIRKSITEYLAEKRVTNNVDPLTWWKVNKQSVSVVKSAGFEPEGIGFYLDHG